MKRDDQDFLDWVSTLPSVLDGTFSEYHNGVGKCVACHVRRANNSGTSYKPLYSAVPLTNDQHQLQHQQGEMAMVERYMGIPCTEATAKRLIDGMVMGVQHRYMNQGGHIPEEYRVKYE